MPKNYNGNLEVETNSANKITKMYLEGKEVDGTKELPVLPDDATIKTYILKAINGVLTWVEEVSTEENEAIDL